MFTLLSYNNSELQLKLFVLTRKDIRNSPDHTFFKVDSIKKLDIRVENGKAELKS